MKKVDEKIIKRFLDDPQFIFPAPSRTNRGCDKIKAAVDEHLRDQDVHYMGDFPAINLAPRKKIHKYIGWRLLIAIVIMLSVVAGSGVIAYQKKLIEFQNGTLLFHFSDAANDSSLRYVALENRLLESGITPLHLPRVFRNGVSRDIKISTTDLSTVAQFTEILTMDNQQISMMCNIESFVDAAMMDNYAVPGVDDFKTITTENAEIYLTSNREQTDIRYAVGNIVYNIKVAADLETAIQIAKTI